MVTGWHKAVSMQAENGARTSDQCPVISDRADQARTGRIRCIIRIAYRKNILHHLVRGTRQLVNIKETIANINRMQADGVVDR